MKKKIVALSVLLIVVFSCENANKVLPNSASIKFEKIEYDFGELPLKKDAQVVFTFENDSSELLQIKDVTTSCGCTVSKWTTNTIKPAQKGTITVTYDALYPGRFIKTITVFYNGKNSPQELKIKGRVQYPKDNS